MQQWMYTVDNVYIHNYQNFLIINVNKWDQSNLGYDLVYYDNYCFNSK